MAIDVFNNIFETIDKSMVANLANGTANLLAIFSPLIQACFGVYVIFIVYSYWQNSSSVEVTMLDLIKRIISWGVIITFSVNLQGYNNYVLPLVNDLGNGMATVFSGYPSSNATILDGLAQQLIDAVTTNQDEAVSLPMPLGLGQYINVVFKNAFIIISFSIFLVVAAAYIILAKVFLSILVVVGPLFISMALFPITRGYATAWLNQVVNYSFLYLLLSITAGIFLSYLSNILGGGLSDTLSDSSIIHIILSTLMMVIILLKLPELASGLAGGVASNGFGNLASIATTATRLKGGFGKTMSSGGSGGSMTGKGTAEAKGK